MAAHPSEGPAGGAVLRTYGLELVCQFGSHAGEGSAAQGFHDDALDAQFLQFVVEVFGIGIATTPTSAVAGMTPVEEVHLNLHEVPVVLVVVVEQVVEHAHVAVVGETEVADAAFLALLHQEVEHAVVDESSAQGIESAAADAVQQVVVDVVGLQALQRLVVEPFRLLQAPEALVLVRHLGGHEDFLAVVPAQGLAHQFLGASAHVHRRRVEIVDTVLDGIIDHAVHLLLVVRQAHHAEAQQRDLFTRSVLHTVGHSARYFCFLGLVVGKDVQRLQRHESHGRASADAHAPQEIAAAQIVCVHVFLSRVKSQESRVKCQESRVEE